MAKETERKKEKLAKPMAGSACPQLPELAGLELKRRQLSRELEEVQNKMRLLNLEIRLLGIEIPWMVRR